MLTDDYKMLYIPICGLWLMGIEIHPRFLEWDYIFEKMNACQILPFLILTSPKW